MASPKVSRDLPGRIDLPGERWLPVVGHEGAYEVSDLGRIWSIPREVGGPYGPRFARGRMRSLVTDHYGYRGVTLGHAAKAKVHVLVARAFLGDPPGSIGTRDGNYQVNHINGDKADNRLVNLEWTTRQENTDHAAATGLTARGGAKPNSLLSPAAVREIRRLRTEDRLDYAALGTRYGVSKGTIGKVLRGETWAHVQ